MFRFHAKHKIVGNIICVVNKSFNDCNVQLFNDVATNAVHIIYNVSTIIYLRTRQKNYVYVYILVDSQTRCYL